ncbi:hypothetical protein GWA01_03730 [Gluconobacter wancherniae NBRC 103581]|uniref:Lipoprotein n=2 Tax=Gluconobacter wancherniae TaxID=1307955 RepID=A0A511AZ73_9PROT|nr:hypothetical protein AA103581_1082 [Gluconobacter wancherniae NBRC 103581]GEK92603.1 hypothetical protein GWA01_03730 [Gluconobacter wancherniae NBRC 103581]
MKSFRLFDLSTGVCMRPIWLSLAILPLLAACSDQPAAPPQQAQGAHPKIPPQDFAPGLAEDTAAPEEKKLLNDPSAPANTPLCGSALREAMQTGAVVYTQSLATSGTCPRNACFDPLTGTFIAANGNRSVCR